MESRDSLNIVDPLPARRGDGRKVEDGRSSDAAIRPGDRASVASVRLL